MFLKVFLRRLFTFLPTILGIATFAFILGHATPGDPAYAALGIDLEGTQELIKKKLRESEKN